MLRFSLFFLAIIAFIGCGREEAKLPLSVSGKPTTFVMEKWVHAIDNAPAAPKANVVIPLSAITEIESEYVSPNLILIINATLDGMDYALEISSWIGLSGASTELEEAPNALPTTPYSYFISREVDSTEISAKFYGQTGFWTGTTYHITLNPQNFYVVGQSVNPPPVSTPPPIDPPPPPLIPPPTPASTPRTPPPPPQSTGYVVWVEKVNEKCQSGVIHSDFVFIDAENKTITFTSDDGNVDPGDMVREYITVETGYTYEQASERAPDILSECDD